MDQLSLSLRARVSLGAHGFHFTHSLGQNFLLDEDAVREIVSRAGVRAGDCVLEIGPGAGVMTGLLADAGASVAAVELDRALEGVLRDVLGARENVNIVFADAMKADLPALCAQAFGPGRAYSIVANLPYYITSDFLLRAVTLSPAPLSITAMVQKEAAERVTASPGDKNWCALAAVVRYYASAEILMDAPARLFTPPPHVDSCLLRLNLRENRPLPPGEEADFVSLIQIAFRMRRKTLANNLTSALGVSREGALSAISASSLDARVRGEALTLEELARVHENLKAIR